MLSYIHHLVVIVQLRLADRPLERSVVDELGRLRVILDKIRPLEQKLRYQVEKLVRKADSFDQTGVSAEAQLEDIANDPLAFRPNPGNFAESRSGSEQEDEGDGIYRPPRIAPVPYTGDKRKGKERAVPPSAMVRDLVQDMASADPYAETTTGLAQAPSFNSKRARELKDMQRYEEENMTRLFMSKKDARRRREDEQDIAMGGAAASTDRRGRRDGGRGGFAELDDFVGQLDRSSKRADKEYDAMRAIKRPNVALRDGEPVRPAKRRKQQGAFAKAVRRK